MRAIKRSLAWKLKQQCYELYAWAGVMPPEHYETKEGEKDRDVKLPALGMTAVELWVAFGTKAIRNNVHDRTWLDYLLKTDHQCDVLLIPDIRFPNEADAIKEMGGLAIKVVRPGYGPRKTVADRALLGYDGWDYVIGAEGTMDSLRTGPPASPATLPAARAFPADGRRKGRRPEGREHRTLGTGVTIITMVVYVICESPAQVETKGGLWNTEAPDKMGSGLHSLSQSLPPHGRWPTRR